MAAANARGPDGEPGARARRKRERAAALAAASSQSGGGGGGGEDAKRTRLDDGDRARGSKRASGECKRATWALHALAKAPDADPASVAVAAKALTAVLRDSKRDAASMDALLASVALYAAAKLRSSARVAEGATDAADDARRELRVCAIRVAARVDARLCARVDARGASNALWALATLASSRGEAGVGERERHAATRALVGALSTRPELRAAFNARDAANALWGCAKARVGLSDEITTQLASAVSGSAPGSAPPGTAGRHPPANAEPTRSRRPWRCGRSRRCEGTGRLAHAWRVSRRRASSGDSPSARLKSVRRRRQRWINTGSSPTRRGRRRSYRSALRASRAASDTRATIRRSRLGV